MRFHPTPLCGEDAVAILASGSERTSFRSIGAARVKRKPLGGAIVKSKGLLRMEGAAWGPGLPLFLAVTVTLGLESLQRRSSLR